MKHKHNWKLIDAATQYEGYYWYLLIYHCPQCKEIKGEYKKVSNEKELGEENKRVLEDQQKTKKES